MHNFRKLLSWLQYMRHSKDKHGVHSPFVFALMTEVINDRKKYAEYDKIELLRSELVVDRTVIPVSAFGARSSKGGFEAGSPYHKSGSGLSAGNKGRRRVGSIARRSLKPSKEAQLLFRLVRYFEPEIILELGTCFGISSLYMAMAAEGSRLVTIEGSPEYCALAKQVVEKTGIKNIELVNANFDDVLSSKLAELGKIDFLFADGNHRKEPILRYFKLCLKHANEDSVFVFDDIHWSEEMEDAWRQIIDQPEVTVSIDLYSFGIVFFRKGQVKQHFVLRF